MNAFYEVHGAVLKNEFDLISRLEDEHESLERKVRNKSRFQAHPKRIRSDSDTTASDSPGPLPEASTRSVAEPTLSRGHPVYQERKQKVHSFKKSLRERLSSVDPEFGVNRHPNSGLEEDDCKLAADRFRSYGDSASSSSDSLPSRRKLSGREIADKGADVSKNVRSRGKLPSPGFCAPARGIPDAVFEKKFKVVCEKSLQIVMDIRTLLSKGVCLPDGDEDAARRITRLKEFSSRFSRNYLYPLARQTKELMSPHFQYNTSLVTQKILSVYQTVLHALQAYLSHWPTSIGNCAADQLKILMNHMIELSVIHRKRVKIDDGYLLEFIDTYKINAELTAQKIGEFLSHPVPSCTILKSENTRVSLSGSGKKSDSGPGRKRTGQNGVDKRFSMYATTASFRKDAPWKRAVETLAKKKFNVTSRYKTAIYKHRPPIQKEPKIVTLPKLKLGVRKKSDVISRTPTTDRHVDEDRIETMVEGCDEVENFGSDAGGAANKEALLIKLLQWSLRRQSNGRDCGDPDALNILRTEEGGQILRELLVASADNEQTGNNQRLTLEIVGNSKTIENHQSENGKSKRKEPKIAVSGEKNARLICITDDNSVAELSEKDEGRSDGAVIVRTNSETQTDIETIAKATQKGTKSHAVKISRLRKMGRPLQPLEKRYAINVIQYKLDFYKHRKNDLMYRKSTNCDPSVLLETISGDVLNDVLVDLARDFKVILNDFVDKIYSEELDQ
ncbi:uncharacterized protein LOC132699509 [Cylas formicarius]|uniref:uncharacterized protein LOC132699509 n=1 Tax=Cylas formicarius TaxID=197179 RepID=UPI002958952B|nr:uncharacterized protein LOC132699509 [Cylas formicarius]